MSTTTPAKFDAPDGPPEANRVRIFDTTLRDGEQSPGASMNMAEKLEMARALAALGVDIIEAGFPIASVGRLRGGARHRHRGRRLVGLRPGPVQRPRHRPRLGGDPVRPVAADPRLPRHLGHPPRAQAADDQGRRSSRRRSPSVRRAKGYCPDIEFSPEDAARTELDFLCEVVEAAIEAGATTVNIPDTVGYATPLQYATVIRTLKERVPNIGRAIISTHCHDDLGMAVANSLAGCEAGARQVECTINGIGERAGNAALEEVVMAPEDPVRLLRPDDQHQDRAALPDQPDALDDHRPGRPAQQGDRGPQRLRPRVGHPPGRHAQGALDLRDHAARGRRRAADRPGPGQALRPPRPARAGRRDGLHAHRRAARDAVPRLQGAGRQEEGSLRRRPRSC